jgi:hypothetical protein
MVLIIPAVLIQENLDTEGVIRSISMYADLLDPALSLDHFKVTFIASATLEQKLAVRNRALAFINMSVAQRETWIENHRERTWIDRYQELLARIEALESFAAQFRSKI